MKTKSMISGALTVSLLATLTANAAKLEMPGQIYIPDNKAVIAWQDGKLGAKTGADVLSMDAERSKKFDFERAARWSPLQVEFALKSYQHVLKNGFSKDQSGFSKALGIMALTIGYEYDVEPSFNQGLYTRSDRYFVSPALEMKKTIKHISDNKLVAGLVPGYNVEFNFQRQFADPKLAILSAPYFDQQIPFNSERALNGLKEGDLFSFKANLDILTDLSYLSSLGLGSVLASAGPHFIVTGGFEVHMLRLPENKVRLKVMGLRRHGGGVKGQIGLDALKVVGAQMIDDKINEKVLDVNLISASYQKNLNRMFAADYILDLKDKNVAAAFDKALEQARGFGYTKVVDPRVKNPQVKDKVLSNIQVLEDLAQKDNGKGLVVRLFHGGNKSSNGEFHINIGNRLMGLGGSTRKSTNEIKTKDENGDEVNYEFATKQKNSDFSFFYSLFQTENRSQVSTISQEQNGELVPISFVMSTERKDKKFSVNELERVQEKMKASLGPTADRIDFSRWHQKQTLSNVVVRTQVVMTTKALNALPEMNEKQIESAYQAHLQDLSLSAQGLSSRVTGTRAATLEERQIDSLSRVKSRLVKVLSKSSSLKVKMEALASLRGNLLFRSTGSGFLLSLLNDEQLASLVRIDVSMSSTDGQKVSLEQGPRGPKDLYSKLLYTENLTNDSELELRLESETLKN